MRNRSDNRGFTVLELTIGVGLAMILGIFALQLSRDSVVLNAAERDTLLMQDDARRAFKRMTAELRVATYAENGAFPIGSATATEVMFYADADKNGVVERIRYYLSGTVLKRGQINPTGNPYSYVTANETSFDMVKSMSNGSTAIFTFYNANYVGTNAALTLPTTNSGIRMVGVTLILDRYPGRLPGPQSYFTQVGLRNLKDNL